MTGSSSREPVDGSCLCGAVRFEITMPTVACVHCHCTMCRRTHGAGFVTWVLVPSKQLRITSGKELSRHRSSDHGARLFCRVCGSSLFGESTRTPDMMYVVRANLRGPIDREPELHASYPNRASWIVVSDDLPRQDDTGILETTEG